MMETMDANLNICWTCGKSSLSSSNWLLCPRCKTTECLECRAGCFFFLSRCGLCQEHYCQMCGGEGKCPSCGKTGKLVFAYAENVENESMFRWNGVWYFKHDLTQREIQELGIELSF